MSTIIQKKIMSFQIISTMIQISKVILENIKEEILRILRVHQIMSILIILIRNLTHETSQIEIQIILINHNIKIGLMTNQENIMTTLFMR